MPAVVAILVAIVKAIEQTARLVKIGEIAPATARFTSEDIYSVDYGFHRVIEEKWWMIMIQT